MTAPRDPRPVEAPMPAALRAELVELLAAALVDDLAADRLRAQSPGILPVAAVTPRRAEGAAP
jgi:hypothetical protein